VKPRYWIIAALCFILGILGSGLLDRVGFSVSAIAFSVPTSSQNVATASKKDDRSHVKVLPGAC